MTHTVLVTGGAGYIGSHTVRQLIAAGFSVIVVDTLYSGHRWAVHDQAKFVEHDAGDIEFMTPLLTDHQVSAVIHFAGHIVVPESVIDPLKYYRNNCSASQHLIQACRETGVGSFIFSSSAAVYGIPNSIPISEDAETAPINPYGATKLVTEWVLRDVAQSVPFQAEPNQPFNYVALRYFNVAGAALDGSLGQATPAATHLIKVACEAALGKRDEMQIFGTDYPTVDGTCIRDYIHVEDLARAHVIALQYLLDGGDSQVLNCGYGRGFSVREVVQTVSAMSGAEFKVVETDRRLGDPAELVADNKRIREVLGWTPEHDDLKLICRTAFEWEKILAKKQSAESYRHCVS